MAYMREQLEEKFKDIDTVFEPTRSEDVRKAHEEMFKTVDKCGSEEQARKAAPHVFKRVEVAEVELNNIHKAREQHQKICKPSTRHNYPVPEYRKSAPSAWHGSGATGPAVTNCFRFFRALKCAIP